MKYCDTKFWVLLLVISTNVNMLFAQLQNNEDQCEGGTSFSSSVYNGSFSSNAAFDNVIGDNSWTTLGKNTSTQEWIAYKFPVSYRINKVRMHSRENFTALGMTNFSIQGSNTSSNGEDGDWVTLISGLNMSPTLFAWNEFSFANNGYYSMYRVIGATSLLGDAGYYIAVSEIEMMGYAQDDVVETQIWSYGTNNSIFYSGNVGIGTNKTENFALSVNGKIRASDIIKIYPKDQWPDFVFENTYKLTPLS